MKENTLVPVVLSLVYIMEDYDKSHAQRLITQRYWQFAWSKMYLFTTSAATQTPVR